MSGVWLVAVLVVAGLACFYAWSWAVRASFMARCAVTEADRAHAMYLEAAALLAPLQATRELVLRPAAPTMYVVPGPPPPVAAGARRRCAVCLSDRDPIEVDFLSAPGGPEAAVYLCKDPEACAARCRGLETVRMS